MSPRRSPRRRGPDPHLRSAAVVVAELHALADPGRLAGMARVGIRTERALGVSLPDLRRLARRVGIDHRVAGELWATGIHDARILAGMVDDPQRVSAAQMERWVRGFDSWDVCDQICSNLFDRTRFAYDKAFAWSERATEFEKRAGFVLMAALAVHDGEARDADLAAFLPAIEREADDDRNYVKKAVNWALRQIGKRSPGLNRRAIASARRIEARDSRAARWIAHDALRELTSDPVKQRLQP